MSEYFCQPSAGYDGDVNSVRADGPLPYGTERMCEPRFEKVMASIRLPSLFKGFGPGKLGA